MAPATSLQTPGGAPPGGPRQRPARGTEADVSRAPWTAEACRRLDQDISAILEELTRPHPAALKEVIAVLPQRSSESVTSWRSRSDMHRPGTNSLRA